MFIMPMFGIERLGVASAFWGTGTSGAYACESARARRWLDRNGAGRSAGNVVRRCNSRTIEYAYIRPRRMC